MPQPSKLKSVELSDGWSFVTRSKGGHSSKNRSQPKVDEPPRQDVSPDEREVTRIIQEIDTTFKVFESSMCAKDLEKSPSLFSQLSTTDSAWCLGLGTFGADSTANTKRSVAQCTVFLWLVKHTAVNLLLDQSRTFVVDPAFTPTDTAVLEHFKLVSNPGLKFSPNGSLFFAPYLPWPVLTLEYLSKSSKKPAMLVCQDLTSVKENLEIQRERLSDIDATIEVDGRECSRDDIERAIEICGEVVVNFEASKFPPYEPLPSAFQDLVIYVSRRVEDET